MKSTDPKSYWALLNKCDVDKKNVEHNVLVDAFYDHFSKLNSIDPDDDNDFDMLLVTNMNDD